MTSLARQLQSLAVPGVTTHGDLQKRPSFLFDSKKAASLDRDEVHALGVNGFEGLCAVDQRFEDSSSLFNEVAKHTERSMLTKQENAELDKNIGKFIRCATPYFLLRSTHKCLEWLIYRFKVHHFNADLLLFAFLPYHTSKLYTRLLQLFEASYLEKKWPILNREVTPSKSVVLEQCVRDRSFFANICENLTKSVQECDQASPSSSGTLRPTINLFTIYSMEMILNLKKNRNEFLAILMPYIVIGIKSKIVDFKASCYMVITLLSSRMTLAEDVMCSLLDLLAKDYKDTALQKECLMTMINLCQTQENVKVLSSQFILCLMKNTRFFTQIQELVDREMEAFLVLVVLKLISLHLDISEENHQSPELLTDLLRSFQLSESGQGSVVAALLEGLSDSEEQSDPFLLKTLFVVHKKYPNAVMNTVTNTVSIDCYSQKMKNLVDALMKVAEEDEFSDCSFLSFSLTLDSPEENLRLSAVITLMQMLKTRPKIKKSDFVRQSVKTRLQYETSPSVVAAMLELVQNYPETFFEDLNQASEILTCLAFRKRGKVEWEEVSETALEILMSDHLSSCSEEVANLITFIVRDRLLYEACVKEQDVASNMKNQGFLKKNNWILSVDWKKGVESIISTVSKMLNANQEAFFQLRSASQKISDLLRQEQDVEQGSVQKLPFHYVVNHAFLSTVMTKGLDIVNEKAVKGVSSVLQEVFSDLHHLLLQSIRDKPIKDEQSDEAKYENFPKCLLAMLTEFHDGKKGCIIEANVMVLFRTLEELSNVAKLSDKHLEGSYYAEWRKIRDANEPCDSTQNEVDKKALYRVVKYQILSFFTQTLLFVSTSVHSDIQNQFQKVMRHFLEIFFQNGEDVVQFLTPYWACTRQSPTNAYSAKIQIQALCLAMNIIRGKKSFKKGVLLSAQSPFIPSLLYSLNDEDAMVRKYALQCLPVIADSNLKGEFHEIVKHLSNNTEVMLDDSSMIVTVLGQFFAPKGSKKSLKTIAEASMKALIQHHIIHEDSPLGLKAGLLHVLSKVKSANLTISVMPQFCELIEICQRGDGLDKDEAGFLKEVICRISPELLTNSAVKAAFWKALDCGGKLSKDQEDLSPQILCLRHITKDFFNGLDDKLQGDIIEKLINMAITIPDSVDAVGKVFKCITLDSKPLKSQFENLISITNRDEPTPAKRLRLTEPKSVDSKDTAWKKIVLFLEFLQEKKKIINIETLLPSLFQILQVTLDENKLDIIIEKVEYVRQLVLTLALHLLKRIQHLHQEETNLDEVIANSCKIELVVHCVRSSASTQTQHHALLLLSEMATYFPEKVLHNVMAIFTFMGSHILRQDDAYSFQVISKTMQVIIPALTKVNKKGAKTKEDAVLRIIHAFVDSLPHVPPHRKNMVLHELLDTLGSSKFLWIVVLLLADMYVRKPAVDENTVGEASQLNEPHSSSLSFESIVKLCCSVCERETLTIQMGSILKCMDYILTLPFSIEGRNPTRATGKMSVIELKSLDTAQLRKIYMASLTLFAHIIEQNQENLLVTLKESFFNDMSDDEFSLVALLQQVYEKVLELICKVTAQKDKQADFPKFSKAVITKCCSILRLINSVLPFETSLGIFNVLLKKEGAFTKCKALELLTEQLATRGETLNDEEVVSVAEICENISGLVCDMVKQTSSENQEHNLLCYTALVFLKTTVRNSGKIKPESFVKSLENMCQVMELIQNVEDIQVTAAIYLSIAEMCSCMKAYCIPYMDQFVPILLLRTCESKTLHNETLLFSCLTLVHRILENLLDFSSSYLEKIIDKITTLLLLEKYSLENDSEHTMDTNNLSTRICMRLKVIVSIIATKVPPRILITVFLNSLKNDTGKSITRIKPLCLFILKHVHSLKRDVSQSLSSISPLLYKLLDFRSECTHNIKPSVVDEIEELTTEISMTVILKLPENSFRSFFFGLTDWAATEETDDRLVTYYKLVLKLSKKMKGLFSLFCGIAIENAASILRRKDIAQNHVLLHLICCALHSIFFSDTSNILTKDRFELLMQPLIDQMENAADNDDSNDLVKVVRGDVIPLLGQIASSIADDTCQKLLNGKILLKSRHPSAVVRHLSLNAVEEVGKRLGEDYSVLLPESIPFLSELMEDDDEEVEKECHAVIRSLEKVVGEPLQKYFNE